MLSSVQSLNFSFASSLASFATPKEIAEYASLRNAWHKRQEALIYQIAWSVKILLKVRETAKAILEAPKTTNEFGEPLTESNSSLDENAAPILDRLSRPFNLGILLVDIIPETSETWIWALLQFLITDKQLLTLKQIKVYSRRPKVDFDVSVPNAFKNITVSWTLCDIPTSDLLITNCLGMHHTLLDEIFAKMECPFTLMFPTTPGLTLARLVSLFKTDLVIMPRVDSSNDKSSIINESDQRAMLDMRKITPGPFVPDLGLKVQQASTTIQSIMPKKESLGNEKFLSENGEKELPRLHYSDEIYQAKALLEFQDEEGN